jgi:hypothetical protein
MRRDDDLHQVWGGAVHCPLPPPRQVALGRSGGSAAPRPGGVAAQHLVAPAPPETGMTAGRGGGGGIARPAWRPPSARVRRRNRLGASLVKSLVNIGTAPMLEALLGPRGGSWLLFASLSPLHPQSAAGAVCGRRCSNGCMSLQAVCTSVHFVRSRTIADLLGTGVVPFDARRR